MPVTKTVANEPRNNSSVALTMTLPRKADFEKALIRQYAKAVQLSRKAGHQVSFRVVVDPLAGAQTISIVEEEPLPQDAFPVEEVREPDDELQAALLAARERGQRRVAQILAEDDMLSAEAFADLLGVSRVTVNTKRQHGPYAALPKLQEILGSAWAVYRFLFTPHGSLDGRTGLDALKRGQDDHVIAAAEGVARGDFR
jgi:hypothetical protein